MRYIDTLPLTIKNKDDLATPANDDEDSHKIDNDNDCDDNDIKWGCLTKRIDNDVDKVEDIDHI